MLCCRIGRLDESGRHPSDVIFPKDVQSDNPRFQGRFKVRLGAELSFCLFSISPFHMHP